MHETTFRDKSYGHCDRPIKLSNATIVASRKKNFNNKHNNLWPMFFK